MNWDDLRFYLSLARNQSVSAAGRELKVKHTTVARRIKMLEANLGTRLFDRLKSGYALTQAGENLYQHAVLMEQQAHAINRQAFGLDAQLKGHLKLTASHDVLNHLVIPQLNQFVQTYPGIKLELLGSTRLADLSARQADIALRLTPKPPEYLIGKKIMPLSHGIYASRQYLETNSKEKHVILWNDQHENPQWVKDHFTNAKVAIRVDDGKNMLACVKDHMGLARLPCYLGETTQDILRLDVKLTPSTWGVWVLSHIDLKSTARVRVCKEFLIDIILKQENIISGSHSTYFDL